MKKVTIVLLILLLTISGCASDASLEEDKLKKIQVEIASLEAEKTSLEQYVSNYKEDNSIQKYVVTMEIKQSHFTLDIGEHIKDSMNKIELELPVDKEYFDSINEGDILNDNFRFGSWLMSGSFGNWNVEILKKEIR
jgi:uncharacterized protein YceK